MKLIIGLGNPGRKYEDTRHNIGFEVVEELSGRWGVTGYREKHQSLFAEAQHASEKVLLLMPQTFMNLSGVAVRAASDFYKLPPTDLLVICDDFNLNTGSLRLKPSGSAGGQNGLANIIQQLGTQDFSRLRVGIGPVPPRWDAAGFVLGKYDRDERGQMDSTVVAAAKAVECWITDGVDAAMNQFN